MNNIDTFFTRVKRYFSLMYDVSFIPFTQVSKADVVNKIIVTALQLAILWPIVIVIIIGLSPFLVIRVLLALMAGLYDTVFGSFAQD